MGGPFGKIGEIELKLSSNGKDGKNGKVEAVAELADGNLLGGALGHSGPLEDAARLDE